MNSLVSVVGFLMATLGFLVGVLLDDGGYFVFVGGCVLWSAAYVADEIVRHR